MLPHADRTAAPQADAEPPNLVYDGRFGELFRLCLKTLLLDLVTLGFYRFWARTRLRRYLWSRVSLAGDRFEYDDTGRELFIRYLLRVVLLLPLLGAPLLATLAGVAADSLRWVADYYQGRRYRLSRTLWRGLRGSLGGRARTYANMGFANQILMALTLGFYTPLIPREFDPS